MVFREKTNSRDINDKQDIKEEEEFVVVDYENEEFIIIKKTVISEPVWGKTVNKN